MEEKWKKVLARAKKLGDEELFQLLQELYYDSMLQIWSHAVLPQTIEVDKNAKNKEELDREELFESYSHKPEDMWEKEEEEIAELDLWYPTASGGRKRIQIDLGDPKEIWNTKEQIEEDKWQVGTPPIWEENKLSSAWLTAEKRINWMDMWNKYKVTSLGYEEIIAKTPKGERKEQRIWIGGFRKNEAALTIISDNPFKEGAHKRWLFLEERSINVTDLIGLEIFSKPWGFKIEYPQKPQEEETSISNTPQACHPGEKDEWIQRLEEDEGIPF